MNRLDRIIKQMDLVQAQLNKFDNEPVLANAIMLIINQQVLHTDLLLDIRDGLYEKKVVEAKNEDPNKWQFENDCHFWSEENSE